MTLIGRRLGLLCAPLALIASACAGPETAAPDPRLPADRPGREESTSPPTDTPPDAPPDALDEVLGELAHRGARGVRVR